MANTCFTSIRIRGKRDDLNKVNDIIKKATTRKDLHGEWLGSLLPYVGYSCRFTEKVWNNDAFCLFVRGKILDTAFTAYNELSIDTETAWEPALKIFLRLVEKYAPDATIWFDSEEPACMGYVSNDPVVLALDKRYEACSAEDFQ